MKTAKYLTLALCALTLAACNFDGDTALPSGTFEVAADAEYTDTRTTINTNGELKWTNDDILGLYAEEVQPNSSFVRKNNKFVGSFAYTGTPEKEMTFYAYSPYAERNDGYTIYATLPAEQNATFEGSADFMVAKALNAVYSESKDIEGLNFVFGADSHLFTILRLRLADNELGALAKERITDIEIESEGNTLCGDFNVDIRDAKNAVTFTSSQDKIVLTYPTPASLESTVEAWAVVRPTDEGKPINLTIRITTTGGSAEFQTSTPIELKRSTIKELPVIYVADKWKKIENINAAFTDPYLLKCVMEAADDGDGKLTPEELEKVVSLSCSSMGVQSLKGIELLSNLKVFDCSHNNITQLDLSACTALQTLNVSGNSFENINVNNNTALTSLTANNTEIAMLDATKCKNLTEFIATEASITELNLSGLTKLTTCNISGNISELNLSKCTSLTALSCINAGLTSLDVSGCTSLASLDCYDNSQLSTLILTGCTALSSIMCRQCAFESLDLSGLKSLQTIYCQRNSLSSIKLTGCTSLGSFYAHTNKWVVLDLSPCISLNNANLKDTPTLQKVILNKNTPSSVLNLENCGSPTIEYK